MQFVRELLLISAALVSSCAHGADTPLVREEVSLQIEVGTHAGPIRRIASDARADIVVTASDDKTARVWRLSTRELLRTLRVPVGTADEGRLYEVAIDPSGATVAIGGTAVGRGDRQSRRAEILIFDINTGQLRQRIRAAEGEIKRLVWSADGALLFAGTSGPRSAVLAFDSAGKQVLNHSMTGAVYGLAAGREGMLAATDFSGAVQLFKAIGATVEPIKRLSTPSRGPVSVALSPDSGHAVVGYFASQRPTIIELATGRSVRTLEPRDRDIDSGYLMTVAWSRNGKDVYAAGATKKASGAYGVWRFDAESGESRAFVAAASDSILDLSWSDDTRLLFASFDASWGIAEGDKLKAQVVSAVPDLRGSDGLRVDRDGTVVSWSALADGRVRHFDVVRRVVEESAVKDLQGPVTRRGWIGSQIVTTDANGRLPYVLLGGRKIPLGDGELAITGTYLPDLDDAVVGTSKTLMRLNGVGQILWRVEPGSEVNAVVPARGGALLVTAMSDGTLRWWNARSGALLLTLLSTRTNAWIAWTPAGYFDASAGADGLVGWVISHLDEGTAELYSLGRFRDRYQRPDIVDRVMQKLDVATAVAEAPPSERDLQRVAEAATPTPVRPSPAAPVAVSGTEPRPSPPKPTTSPAGPGTSVPMLAATPPVAPPSPSSTPLLVPPALSALDLPSIRTTSEMVTLRFAVRASTSTSALSIFARLNGRPVDAEVVLPASFDGKSSGQIRLHVPAGRATVHVVASQAQGLSDPLTYSIEVAVPASSASAPKVAPVDVRPRLFVLAVGVSDYERVSYRLGLPAKDARDFADLMEKQNDKQYRSVEVRRLVNRDATRKQVLEQLRWLGTTTSPGDVAILFMAGHGVNVNTGQYYFLPVDANHERLQDTGVPERDIRDALARVKGHALFFVDTCYAGNVIGNPRTASRELSRLASELGAAENGVVVFASSSGRQESEESISWGNGAFTRAVLSGLTGRADFNGTGRVTYKGLDFYVSEEVRRLTNGRQTPVTISPSGIADFELVRF